MVGLDIGSKTIKIAELQKEGDSYSLSASGIIGYTGSPIEKMTDEKEIAALAAIIKKLHSETGAGSKDVAISLPEPQVFTRTIKFPMLTEAEIASAVKWEAEQYIPIPINEAIIQHTILRRNEKATPPEVSVLLVAAPRVVVEKYIKVVTTAGLNPVVVETELLALTRALAPHGRTVLLIDFGAGSTDIAIAHDTLLSFSRSIPVAGEAFTRAVSQGLRLTIPQAEEYKKTYGFDSKQLEGKVKGALEPVLRLVVDEIKKAAGYYQAEEKGEVPEAMIVSGGTSGMPEIVTALASLTGTEVLVANPFKNIRTDAETAKRLTPFAPLYSVAIGLAMVEE